MVAAITSNPIVFRKLDHGAQAPRTWPFRHRKMLLICSIRATARPVGPEALTSCNGNPLPGYAVSSRLFSAKSSNLKAQAWWHPHAIIFRVLSDQESPSKSYRNRRCGDWNADSCMWPKADGNVVNLGLFDGNEVGDAAYYKKVTSIAAHECKQVEVRRLSHVNVLEEEHHSRNITHHIAEGQCYGGEHQGVVDVVAQIPKENNSWLRNSLFDDTFNNNEESAK